MRILTCATLLAAGIHLPGTTATAQSPGVTEIPLSTHAGHLIVPVQTAGGATLDFILSTGGATVFSESGAARANGQALSMGGIAVSTENSRTLPDTEFTRDGKVLAGMIGANTLNQYDILVDAPNGKLLLKPVGPPARWEGVRLGDPVRLRVYHGVVVGFDVEINGHEYQAFLDLGTSQLVVNTRVQTDNDLDVEDTVTLGIGNGEMADLPVVMRELQAFQMAAPNGEGVLMVGAPIAWDCAIAISWVHRELRTCAR